LPSTLTLSFRKTLVTSVDDIEKLRPLWNRLAHESGGTVFQKFEWNRLAAEIFRDRMSPAVCAVEGTRGAAIIPMALNRQRTQLELLGDALFDYRDLLHAGGPEALKLAWEMVEEFDLPISVVAVEPHIAKRHWWRLRPTEFARAPWVDASRITAGDFRAIHTRSARQLRRMERKGVRLRRYSGMERDLVQRIYQLKADQFAGDDNNVFRDESRREFMVAVAAKEAQNCQVFTLEDNSGGIVAGLVTFLDGGVRRFYTIYFEPDWAVYSPGVALVFATTAISLEQGVSCDYMTGEYGYKLRFANANRMLYRIDASAEQIAAIAQEQERRIA
jgi:CelD/BcsL family acetyltransferase involved in cellulose biosynthesis